MWYQRVKLTYGADGSATDVSDAAPLPVDDAGGSLTVDAPVGTPVNVQIGDGTDTALVSAGGALQVDVASALPTGTNAIGTVTAVGAAAENAAASGNPNLVGGRYDLTPRTLGAGDVGALALDVNGHLITSPHATATALSDDVSNSVNILVDDAGAFIGHGVFPFMFDGTTWDRVRGTSADGIQVNLGANNDVTIDGSSIVLAEDAVHGSGDAGIMPLAVRNDDLAALAGTDGDYAPLQVDESGALYVNPAGSGDIGRASIDVAASGDNTLLAAQGVGVRIRVTSYVIVATGTVAVRFEDGAGGAALSGQMNLVANTGVSSGFNPHGHFETTANTLLNLELSAAVAVDGHFTYVLVP